MSVQEFEISNNVLELMVDILEIVHDAEYYFELHSNARFDTNFINEDLIISWYKQLKKIYIEEGEESLLQSKNKAQSFYNRAKSEFNNYVYLSYC